MGRRRGQAQLDPMDEINLTPMIDLVFLLLIVFMITTPLLENALDVTPPELNANEVADKNTKTVELDRAGKIVFDGKTYSVEELGEYMRILHGENPTLNLNLRADGEQVYKEITKVLGTIASAGFKNINLITLQEGQGQ